MRAVVQRVSRASVSVGGETAGAIGRGFVVLLGVAQGDAPEDALSVAETDDNLGHAEEEGLDPVFHEFAIKRELVVLAADLNARLKLYPVDGGSWRHRFCVPDCAQKSVSWLLERD